jgi:hypothetical protein
VSWLKLLSLIAVVVALVAAQGVGDRAWSGADRTELPANGGGNDDGIDGDDAPAFTLPPHALAAPNPMPSGRMILESGTAPATSDLASRIFRPPIRAAA